MFGAAIEFFRDAKDFWNVLSFAFDAKPKSGAIRTDERDDNPASRSRSKRVSSMKGSLEKRDDNDSCDDVFNQALQVCATRCPGGTQPEEVVDPQSWEPCTGAIASSTKRSDTNTNQADDEKTLHSIVDKNRDRLLDLGEYIEWANYSSVNKIMCYKDMKPWVRFFFAYDENGDGKVEVGEVYRPRSKNTWVGDQPPGVKI